VRRSGSLLKRVWMATAVIAVALLPLAAQAQGSVTIGSALSGPADEINPGCSVPCTIMNPSLPAADTAPGGLSSPVNGTVTSWRFKSVSPGDIVSLRVLRPAGGTSFRGAGTSAAATSTGVVPPQGPFATSLPIQIGDYVGLNGSANSTLLVDTPASQLYWNAPTLADGQTLAGTTGARVVAVQAIVEPTNTVTFGTVTRNKKKGSARLMMSVPNAGQLIYSGNSLSVSGLPSVAAPTDLQLTVKAIGKKRKKLNSKGKVGASFQVTFTPNQGIPRTTTESFKLRKKL
jgi:hypothetical protein